MLSTHQEALASAQGSLETMHQSPRTRRLHNDLAALERLRAESSVFRFSATGDPPQQYHILFQGKGLCRDRSQVKVLDHHRVEIKLGASYPRSMPEIRWVTPIHHPNISEIGMVCLGGYGTHWVPSVQLDELCVMLWDMLRFHNYDIRSPYNREAALWTAGQTNFRFPIDARPLRDLRASQGRAGSAPEKAPKADASRTGANRSRRSSTSRAPSENPVGRVLQFIERYGRVFGDASTPAVGRDDVTAAMSRSRPGVDPVRHMIERVAQFANEATPEPASSSVGSETPHPSLEPEGQATTLAGTDPAGPDAEPRNDVLIMEASPEDARFEAPHRRGDDDDEEIIFID
jgi:ubiquitin-protein ligase